MGRSCAGIPEARARRWHSTDDRTRSESWSRESAASAACWGSGHPRPPNSPTPTDHLRWGTKTGALVDVRSPSCPRTWNPPEGPLKSQVPRQCTGCYCYSYLRAHQGPLGCGPNSGTVTGYAADVPSAVRDIRLGEPEGETVLLRRGRGGTEPVVAHGYFSEKRSPRTWSLERSVSADGCSDQTLGSSRQKTKFKLEANEKMFLGIALKWLEAELAM